jgi:hypothetical protein
MKRIVRQVGYLQRLYRDAQSTEHKIIQVTSGKCILGDRKTMKLISNIMLFPYKNTSRVYVQIHTWGHIFIPRGVKKRWLRRCMIL